VEQGSSSAPSCPMCGGPHRVGETCPGAQGHDAAAATGDPLIGSMVGSFRIQRPLGRGGMGAVYLGEHPVIGSKVAIKFLHESLAQNPELVGRFYDEARAVNLIGHENIVAIYDLALLPPARYYIVMEYLEGRTLAAEARRGPMEQALALDVLAQLTDALQAAHERGVVHRDLKPENVFLVRRQETDHFVKLMDFGIAKLGDRGEVGHTAAGMIVGTPEYMAPEQCESKPVDARTDVYALGVMAYEVATGRLPFTGASIAQVLLAHLKQRPPPPRDLRAGLHPAFERIILRALEKRPEDRFPEMRAFGLALRAAIEGLAARTPPAPVPPPAEREAAAGQAPPPTRVAPAAPPAAAAERPAPPLARVEVEVRSDGGARRLRVGEISPGGLFLCDGSELPDLFTQATVVLRGGAGEPVPVLGDVVRHVSPSQARSWSMEPGFALQLRLRTTEERLALEALGARLREASLTPAGDRETIDGVTALRLLESLEKRAQAGLYELLDLPEGSGLPEVRLRARGLRRQVQDLRVKLPPQAQVSRTEQLLERIEQASLVLGTPGERLLHDARRGNFRGVAQCVTAGLPAPLVESRRRAFLAERPGREATAEKHLARAQVARKMGNLTAALSELEAALRADPLNLRLHEQHGELEAKLRPPPG